MCIGTVLSNLNELPCISPHKGSRKIFSRCLFSAYARRRRSGDDKLVTLYPYAATLCGIAVFSHPPSDSEGVIHGAAQGFHSPFLHEKSGSAREDEPPAGIGVLAAGGGGGGARGPPAPNGEHVSHGRQCVKRRGPLCGPRRSGSFVVTPESEAALEQKKWSARLKSQVLQTLRPCWRRVARQCSFRRY